MNDVGRWTEEGGHDVAIIVRSDGIPRARQGSLYGVSHNP